MNRDQHKREACLYPAGCTGCTSDASRPVHDTQGAVCPTCGRYVRLLIDGQYEAHTIPGVYDRGCHEGGR
jgi:hypothetical protein